MTTNVQRLTLLQQQIVLFLDNAHKDGIIDVSVGELAANLAVSAEDIGDALRSLTERGLLDKLEVAGCACLSATGFRYARVIKSGNVNSASAELTQNQSSVRPAIRGREDQEFLDTLGSLVAQFGPAVDDSTLSGADKQRLKLLCNEFFGHPATYELLRRSLLQVPK